MTTKVEFTESKDTNNVLVELNGIERVDKGLDKEKNIWSTEILIVQGRSSSSSKVIRFYILCIMIYCVMI